jgi:tetratricopeptide (TPR) repeat protein
MAPYSLPALTRAAEVLGKDNLSQRRYAIYQLERIDRRSPMKALRDAPSNSLKAELMMVFAETAHREGVYAVLPHLNDGAPDIRAAARKAWDVYLKTTPHKPPERRLELPGGKLSDERVPLWLDHKQLMHEALRKELEKRTGTMPPEIDTVEAMTTRLLTLYDEQRKKELDQKFDAALTAARGDGIAEATAVFDAILAQNPNYDRRSEMTGAYLRLGDTLADEKKWRDAATAYGKAHSVAPAGDLANSALSKHHFARGKEVEKAGGDATAEFTRAIEVDPEQRADNQRGGRWMLVAGLVGGLAGIAFLVLGFRRRS